MLKAWIAISALVLLVLASSARASIFGEENIALMKLVVGQIVELEKLAAALEVAKEQRDLIEQINAGVNRTIAQIEAIEEILNRAQGLDPRNIRRISELTDAILEVRELKRRAQDIQNTRILIANNAIAQSGLQAETAYTMGQEMIRTGTDLSREATSASPGRSAQITATAQSAQTLSSGVVLQTLSHIAQLQAVSLEFQKAQAESRLIENQSQSDYFRSQLLTKGGGK